MRLCLGGFSPSPHKMVSALENIQHSSRSYLSLSARNELGVSEAGISGFTPTPSPSEKPEPKTRHAKQNRARNHPSEDVACLGMEEGRRESKKGRR